jgi:hypothetical protein
MKGRQNIPANPRAAVIQPVQAETGRLWLIALLTLNMAVTIYAGGELRLRTALCLPLLAVIFLRSFGQAGRINSLRLGRAIVLLWVALALWCVTATVANHGDLWKLTRELVERHLTSFAAMMAIILCAKGRFRRYIAVAIVVLISFSAFVGVMQWLNQPWAYSLKYLTNVTGDSFGLDVEDIAASKDLISGMSLNAYVMGYTMAVGASMLLAIMLEGTTLRRAVAAAQFMVLLTALLILQQRSAVVAFAICAVAFSLKAGQSMRGRTLRTMLVFLLMGLSCYVVFRWVSHRAEVGARYELTRYEKFWIDESRLLAVESALEMASTSPLVGTAPRDFVERSQFGAAVAPHNLFFNALLLYGLPGLLITASLVLLQLELCRRVWRLAWQREDFTAVGCVLGMVAYLINCQFHNPSLLTGDATGWWMTGLLIAALQDYQNDESLQPNGARVLGVRNGPLPSR